MAAQAPTSLPRNSGTTATRKTVVLPAAVIKADNAKGEITAVVNTGFKDRQNDTMASGCWQKVCREKQRPILFWHHDLKELALGSASYLEELAPGDSRIPAAPKGMALSRESYDAGALLAKMQFALQTQRGHDAYILARDGHVREWSVQFTTTRDGEESDGKGGRVVKMVDWLVEISLVPAGASLGTYTIEAKDARLRVESWLGPITEMAEDRAWDRLQAAEDATWQKQYDFQQSIARTAEGMAFRQLMNAHRGYDLDSTRINWAAWRRLRGL